jgi:hypothetical protein
VTILTHHPTVQVWLKGNLHHSKKNARGPTPGWRENTGWTVGGHLKWSISTHSTLSISMTWVSTQLHDTHAWGLAKVGGWIKPRVQSNKRILLSPPGCSSMEGQRLCPYLMNLFHQQYVILQAFWQQFVSVRWYPWPEYLSLGAPISFSVYSETSFTNSCGRLTSFFNSATSKLADLIGSEALGSFFWGGAEGRWPGPVNYVVLLFHCELWRSCLVLCTWSAHSSKPMPTRCCRHCCSCRFGNES